MTLPMAGIRAVRSMAFKQILKIRARSTTLRRLVQVQRTRRGTHIRVALIMRIMVDTSRRQGRRRETSSGRVWGLSTWRGVGATGSSVVSSRQVRRATISRASCSVRIVMRCSRAACGRRKEKTAARARGPFGLVACASGGAEFVEGYVDRWGGGVGG